MQSIDRALAELGNRTAVAVITATRDDDSGAPVHALAIRNASSLASVPVQQKRVTDTVSTRVYAEVV